MTALLPIVEQLCDCQTDAERADWLLRVPQGVICRDNAVIRMVLRTAGFLIGVEYIDAELAALNSTRTEQGCWRDSVLLSIGATRAALLDVVCKGGGQ
ncbi:hypothetical protein HGO34_03230 [Agrobacterium vitis]|uniref:Uncharacterized protein n=1 Tax=Agrobacterium vitis TaxID=373 RepID=A0AAE5ATZ2_AGRVI|nr:hypothetical protein [Agrobacterium vitis]MCF1497803.1 hypothetical protein [Allorhizobium sp. Av2]MCM2438730.1 hypothetical protein [Agrobacterium vitis]MUZ55944.1 hypothetical protein [Agrobacterium vitis]MVA68752.1 hypothetical protein [Agrobacterium vitis]MVA89514.1 hypothetical protein [Agrobacterium vitis]